MPYLTGVGRFLPLVLARPPAFGEWRLAAMPTRLYPIAESSARSVARPPLIPRFRHAASGRSEGRTRTERADGRTKRRKESEDGKSRAGKKEKVP